MREARGAAEDVRTAGSVERLEYEEARAGQRAGWRGRRGQTSRSADRGRSAIYTLGEALAGKREQERAPQQLYRI